MKYIPIALILFSISCKPEIKQPKTDREKMIDNIYQYIESDLNDPESFEFVGITDIDTITRKYNIETEIAVNAVYLKDLEYRREKYDNIERDIEELERVSPRDPLIQRSREKLAEFRAGTQARINERDSLKALLDTVQNEILYFNLKYKFRATNKTGNKELYKYLVSLDKDLSVNAVSVEE